MSPQTQTALIQLPAPKCPEISTSESIPTLSSPHHVLVRVLAVALNPNDYKMLDHFSVPVNGAGCDFCGVIQSIGDAVGGSMELGTRVCGSVFPYSQPTVDGPGGHTGAFAEWLVADSRLILRVPDDWSDLQGAALGGVGWSTVGLAMSHPDAMDLTGLPSRPCDKMRPVLVYGGGTATGTMACQLLKLSGYSPIAVVQSVPSADMAIRYGAASVTIRDPKGAITMDNATSGIGDGAPIRHALDCITDSDSAAFCFGTFMRTGGRYSCLERFRETWRTRRLVKVKEVMGYEVLGQAVNIGGPSSAYTRNASDASFAIGMQWAAEMQLLLDRRLVKAHPVQEIPGGLGGVLEGLGVLRAGGIRGRKLAVQLCQR